MFAAVQALREAEPAQIVITVPSAPESTCRELDRLVDDMVCASKPTPFCAVGVKPVSTDGISTVCIVPCRRWSAFWTRSIR